MQKLILASNSPRRKEILTRLGLEFSVCPQDVDESFEGLSSEDEAMRLSEKKVRACIESGSCGKDDISKIWILGADTFIECEGSLIGKPADRMSARIMLEQLSGNTHTVITGLSLQVPETGILSTICRTDVTFAPITTEEISWYLDTEEWQGAAAAYRIQEKGAVFVDSISGSYSNVMGLPINTFYGMLRTNNFNFRI